MKKYSGIVVDNIDPLKNGRYKIIVPELMQRPDNKFTGSIWSVNLMDTYVRYRTKDNLTHSSGKYTPLRIGTPVLVEIQDYELFIVGINSTGTSIPDPDNPYLRIIDLAEDGSIIAHDEMRGITQISRGYGKSNILLMNDRIDLDIQVNDATRSSVQIEETGISLIFGDTSIVLNSTGIGLNVKDAYYKMTSNGIEMHAPDSIHMSSKKSAQMTSKNVNISSTNEINLRSNDTKITGSQKLSLTGSQIILDSFLGIFLTSMYIKVKASIKSTFESTLMDINVKGIRNDFANIFNNVTSVQNSTSNMASESFTTKVQDGSIISNMGVAASVSSSLNTSVSASMKAIDTSMSVFGTSLLMNNPVTASASSILTENLKGVASIADEPLGSAFNIRGNNYRNGSIILNNARRRVDEMYYKYTTVPDVYRGDINGWI